MWSVLFLAARSRDFSSGMIFWFVLVGFVVMASVFQSRKRGRVRRARTAWRAAAHALGFDRRDCHLGSLLRIRGRVEGQEVAVRSRSSEHATGAGKGTWYEVGFRRPLGLGVRISSPASLSDRFHGERVFTTGDAAFDRAALVRTSDPAETREWLDADRRDRIRHALVEFPGLTIDERGLAWARPEVSRDPKEIEEDARHMAALARALLRVDRPRRAARHEDHPEPPVPARRPAPATRPPPLPIVTDPLPPASSEPPPPPPPEPVPALEVPAAAPAPEGLPLVDVATDLFAGELSSFEAGQRFRDRYEGKLARGEGELRDVDAYSLDFDFGGGAGTKAVVALTGLRGRAFENREVLAILELPPGRAEDLAPRMGTKVAFEGVLFKADGFLRKALLEDAAIDPV